MGAVAIAYQQGKCSVMEDVHFSARGDKSFYHTFKKGIEKHIIVKEGVAWHC